MASVLDDYEVHPLAAIFPMLSDEELTDLAEDIKENGLLHPIVRTLDGVIVDGRNRLVACVMAGVEPEFENRVVDDDQARALIVSANLQRRNITKGQQAMALAIIYPETDDKGGRGHKAFGDRTVSRERLSIARAVLRAAPDDLTPQVVAGIITLDKAYLDVVKRQQDASGETARLARLRQLAPDLVDLVTEERMTLGDALAAANQRAEERRVAIEQARRASENLLNLCTAAVTIAGGYELGERGLVTAEQLTQLDNAIDLLKRLYREETDARK
jgi:ParB-like chromosome segregation protein Spo0J